MRYRGVKFVSVHQLKSGAQGRGFGIVLPLVMVDELGIEKGDLMAVSTDGKEITVTPVPKSKPKPTNPQGESESR